MQRFANRTVAGRGLRRGPGTIFSALIGLLAAAAAWAQTPAPGLKTPAGSPAQTAAHSLPSASAYYHFLRARMAEDRAGILGDRRDVHTALRQYQLAIHADPESAYLPDQMASLLFRIGRTGDAIRLARGVTRMHPRDVRGHELLGWIYTHLLGNAQDPATRALLLMAARQYQTLVRLRPRNIDFRLHLAQLLVANHQYGPAAAQFMAVLRQQPGQPRAMVSLITLDGRQGRIEDAQNLLASVPSTARTPAMELALGRALARQHHPGQAITAYRAALARNPHSLPARRALARLLLQSGQTLAALRQYRLIAAQAPDNARAWLQITAIEEKRGHFPQAEAALAHAGSLLPGSPEVGYFRAVLYEAEYHNRKARRELQRLLTQTASPTGQYQGEAAYNRSAFLEELGRLERARHHDQAALADFRQMKQLGQRAQRHAALEIITTWRRARHYHRALAVATAAVKQFPGSAALRIRDALLLAETGQAAQARRMLQPLMQLQPHDAGLYIVLGEIEQSARHWGRARRAAQQAARLARHNQDRAEAALLAAEIAGDRGAYARAGQDYRRALTFAPGNAMVLNDYGYMLANRGRHLRRALGYIQAAVRQEAHNSAYLDSLGWAHFQLHQYRRAALRLHQAWSMARHDPTILGHLASLALQTGHLSLAVSQAQSAVAAWRQTPPGDFDSREARRIRRVLRQARQQYLRRESAQQLRLHTRITPVSPHLQHP